MKTLTLSAISALCAAGDFVGIIRARVARDLRADVCDEHAREDSGKRLFA